MEDTGFAVINISGSAKRKKLLVKDKYVKISIAWKRCTHEKTQRVRSINPVTPNLLVKIIDLLVTEGGKF